MNAAWFYNTTHCTTFGTTRFLFSRNSSCCCCTNAHTNQPTSQPTGASTNGSMFIARFVNTSKNRNECESNNNNQNSAREMSFTGACVWTRYPPRLLFTHYCSFLRILTSSSTSTRAHTQVQGSRCRKVMSKKEIKLVLMTSLLRQNEVINN